MQGAVDDGAAGGEVEGGLGMAFLLVAAALEHRLVCVDPKDGIFPYSGACLSLLPPSGRPGGRRLLTLSQPAGAAAA
jgi:hypothetical protein